LWLWLARCPALAPSARLSRFTARQVRFAESAAHWRQRCSIGSLHPFRLTGTHSADMSQSDSPQAWLRPNRRVLTLAMILPALLVLVGGGMALTCDSTSPLLIAWVAIVAVGLALIGMLLRQLTQPRLAQERDELLVYLKRGAPFRLPLPVVECFFLGATNAKLPAAGEGDGKISALVIRLAERATDWHERPVKKSLGEWDEGYVRIKGAWCEPLSLDLVNRLNRQLREAQRAAKETA